MFRSKILPLVKSVICHTCIIFTAASVIMHILAATIADNSVKLEIYGILTILLISFIIALCNLIFRVRSFPLLLKLLIHFLVVTSAVVFTFFALTPESASSRGAIVLVSVFAAGYAVAAVISIAVTGKRKRKESDSSDYKPQFEALTRNDRKKR